jgi:hypothetical protein
MFQPSKLGGLSDFATTVSWGSCLRKHGIVDGMSWDELSSHLSAFFRHSHIVRGATVKTWYVGYGHPTWMIFVTILNTQYEVLLIGWLSPNMDNIVQLCPTIVHDTDQERAFFGHTQWHSCQWLDLMEDSPQTLVFNPNLGFPANFPIIQFWNSRDMFFHLIRAFRIEKKLTFDSC